MNELPDPLQELLQPAAHDEPSELRERLRKQTSRSVRRRAALRLLACAGSVAACLLAIALVSYWIDRTRRDRPPEMPPVAVVPRPLPERDATAAAEVRPVALEWQAFDSTTNRAAAYFLAGNKYLEASEDVESALRCYAQALDACTPDELDIAPDDNWLVVSLKNARRKENVHD